MRSVSCRLLAVVAAISLSVVTGTASALDTKFHYKAGYDGGGDTLITVRFTNGDTENIKANRGLFFGGGVSFLNDARNLETEVSLSYKIDDITASNGDVKWSRWPLDILVFYCMPQVRLGGGVTFHLNPDFSTSGAASVSSNGTTLPSVNFKNAQGMILQGDWRINDKMNLGLRYTSLDYEIEGSSAKLNSDGFGIVFSGHF